MLLNPLHRHSLVTEAIVGLVAGPAKFVRRQESKGTKSVAILLDASPRIKSYLLDTNRNNRKALLCRQLDKSGIIKLRPRVGPDGKSPAMNEQKDRESRGSRRPRRNGDVEIETVQV